MEPKRVTVVADELLGYVRTGGLGTAATFLSLALARMGHQVEALYVGESPDSPLSGEWAPLYAEAGVSIRHLPKEQESAEPRFFTQMRATELALRSSPPDVVITQDLAAPTYTALRLRQLGRAFEQTLFVVHCYGTRRWITDVSRKVRVLPGAHAVTALEQASLELADVVVSPSEYLVGWMREQGWLLPEKTVVIPHFTRSAATGASPPTARSREGGPVQRLAFFGRLEERKGLRPFVAALNALEPELLDLELDFIGRATPAWPPERIEGLLSERSRSAFRRISFETDLDQHEALARLGHAGTLVVMPSFAETFGNAVRECLEHGLPFIASNTGAIPELVAGEDRKRTLFDPTPEGIAEALRRALCRSDALVPARPAFDDSNSWGMWEQVLSSPPARRAAAAEGPEVDVVVVHRHSQVALLRCLEALGRQSYERFAVIVAIAAGTETDGSTRDRAEYVVNGRAPVVVRSATAGVDATRTAGLDAVHAPWVVFLDEQDVPREDFLETLVQAQSESGADVVTCGYERLRDDGDRRLHFFLGDPGGVGVLWNAYGGMALLRRSLLREAAHDEEVEGDHDWPLLAALSAGGARIVSVPIPLVTRSYPPGSLEQHPADALVVAAALERGLPAPLRTLARLAAGLAADSHTAATPTARRLPDLTRRIGRRALRSLHRNR